MGKTTSSSYAEKRKRPRAGGEFELVLSTDSQGSERKVRVRDVSSSGVSCHVESALPEMTQVQIDLHLPDDDLTNTVTAEGAVVRCREIEDNPPSERFEVAIFFTGISDDGRLNIERYVMNRLKGAE